MYLDVENKELTILRALQAGVHHNVYAFWESLIGDMDDVIIQSTKKWGMIWYFKHEEEWKAKYLEAKKALKELPDIEEPKFSKPDSQRSQTYSKTYNPSREYFDLWNKPILDKSLSVWKDIKLSTINYRCVFCQNEFHEKDMSSIPNYSIKEGTCRSCMRKKDQQRNLGEKI